MTIKTKIATAGKWTVRGLAAIGAVAVFGIVTSKRDGNLKELTDYTRNLAKNR